ncbi:MAG: hypothetical protein Q8876_07440 [Bacillota bacterium]|nr:hypothetical protein [Bacillota bacterium]
MGDDEINLKSAMLKCALGYEYEEKTVEMKKDGSEGKVKIIKRHIPPNPKLINEILYLIRCERW